MSKGQFYYHFKNKQALYFALVEVLITRKQAFLATVMQPKILTADIFTIFKTQIQQGITFARTHPEIQAFSESFLREKGNPIFEEVMTRFNFDNDAGLNQLIEVAHRKGEFHANYPLPFVQQLLGALFSHATDLADFTTVADAEVNLERLVQFMQSGLAHTSD